MQEIQYLQFMSSISNSRDKFMISTPKIIYQRPPSIISRDQLSKQPVNKISIKMCQAAPVYNATPHHNQPVNHKVKSTIESEKTRLKTNSSGSNYSSYCPSLNSSFSHMFTSQIYQISENSNPNCNIKYNIGPNLNKSLHSSFDGNPNVSRIFRQAQQFKCGNTQPSYEELLEQNKKLRKIVKQDYEPLKEVYRQLKKNHEQRDYLLSQLEWKVKQLAKQVQSTRQRF